MMRKTHKQLPRLYPSRCSVDGRVNRCSHSLFMSLAEPVPADLIEPLTCELRRHVPRLRNMNVFILFLYHSIVCFVPTFRKVHSKRFESQAYLLLPRTVAFCLQSFLARVDNSSVQLMKTDSLCTSPCRPFLK